jgi:ribosomal protein S18 acetylase RimI-like enzyme
MLPDPTTAFEYASTATEISGPLALLILVGIVLLFAAPVVIPLVVIVLVVHKFTKKKGQPTAGSGVMDMVSVVGRRSGILSVIFFLPSIIRGAYQVRNAVKKNDGTVYSFFKYLIQGTQWQAEYEQRKDAHIADVIKRDGCSVGSGHEGDAIINLRVDKYDEFERVLKRAEDALRTVVYCDSGSVVGYLLWMPLKDLKKITWKDYDELSDVSKNPIVIPYLGVSEEFRQIGIAGEMLDFFLGRCRNRIVVAYPTCDMSKHLCEKRGFELSELPDNKTLAVLK